MKRGIVAGLSAAAGLAMICGAAWAVPESATSASSASSASTAKKAAGAEEAKPNSGALLIECSRMVSSHDDVQIAIWYPQEFLILREMQGGKDRDAASFSVSALAPYKIIQVCRGPLNENDGVVPINEKYMLLNSWLVGKDGSRISPLTHVPVEVQKIAEVIRRSFSNSPKMQKSVLLIFPSQDALGHPLVDEQRRDKLTLLLGKWLGYAETRFDFRTPFDAASAPQKCPACGEQVSPKWGYCPWCGKALPAVK